MKCFFFNRQISNSLLNVVCSHITCNKKPLNHILKPTFAFISWIQFIWFKSLYSHWFCENKQRPTTWGKTGWLTDLATARVSHHHHSLASDCLRGRQEGGTALEWKRGQVSAIFDGGSWLGEAGCGQQNILGDWFGKRIWLFSDWSCLEN